MVAGCDARAAPRVTHSEATCRRRRDGLRAPRSWPGAPRGRLPGPDRARAPARCSRWLPHAGPALQDHAQIEVGPGLARVEQNQGPGKLERVIEAALLVSQPGQALENLRGVRRDHQSGLVVSRGGGPARPSSGAPGRGEGGASPPGRAAGAAPSRGSWPRWRLHSARGETGRRPRRRAPPATRARSRAPPDRRSPRPRAARRPAAPRRRAAARGRRPRPGCGRAAGARRRPQAALA